MPTHDTETLAEVLAAHEFTSTSSSRNGINTHHAGCACGIGFDWYERDVQHRDHLFAVVAAQAKAEALNWAANEAHREARYQTELSMRADSVDSRAFGFAAERASVLELVYRDVALRAVSSVPQATEPTHTNKEES